MIGGVGKWWGWKLRLCSSQSIYLCTAGKNFYTYFFINNEPALIVSQVYVCIDPSLCHEFLQLSLSLTTFLATWILFSQQKCVKFSWGISPCFPCGSYATDSSYNHSCYTPSFGPLFFCIV